MLRLLWRMVGLSTAAVSHLVTIPIMAIYGVTICPVLSERGFGFGCRYTGVFVFGVLVVDSAVNGSLWWLARRYVGQNPLRISKMRFFPLATLLVHLGAFAICTFVLLGYLQNLHVPGPTLERLKVAFFFTALLLGVLQADIVEWLTHAWLRSELAHLPMLAEESGGLVGFTVRWIYGRAWAALPFLVFVLISGTVIARQFMDIAEMDASDLNLGAIQGILYQITQVVGFLFIWLVLVRVFSMLKEKRLVEEVHSHLNALGRLDAVYHSPTVASGFWTGIFRGLNQTTDIISQRARLIKGFSSYVTGSVVDKVLKNQTLRPEGETRELTIISSDLRNFTGISNTLPAEKVVQMLNIYFADMIEVLTVHGVTLDKFIGDGILAYVEDGNTGASAAERGVTAAMAMHERVVSTNQKLSALGLPELAIGVGVHSGTVILGSIGSPDKMQHTIIGDSVNVASRLEPLCKSLRVGVIVSDEVYQRLTPALKKYLKQGGDHEIRGVRERVAVHTWTQATGRRAA